MKTVPGRAAGGLLPWNDSAMFWTTFVDGDMAASDSLVANATECSTGDTETPQLGLYHAANALILLAFCVPTTLPYGQALLHAGLAGGSSPSRRGRGTPSAPTTSSPGTLAS